MTQCSFERALQARAYLLWLDGQRMRYLRLLKLLYIADMADIITTQRIWAFGAYSLPQEMCGIFLRHSSIGMGIPVHYGHARCCKRFSYTHEIEFALLFSLAPAHDRQVVAPGPIP